MIADKSLNAAQACFEQGNAFYASGQYADALVKYDKAIAIKPDYADAHRNRGATLENLRRYDEAIVSYNNALAINPHYGEVYCSRGNALYHLYRYEDAWADYNKAASIRPDYVEAHFNGGIVLEKLRRYQDALRSYDTAVALNPSHFKAYNNRGNALLALERYMEALPSFDKAITLNPHYAEAFNNRSIALLRLGQNEEAYTSADKAIAFNPAYADAYINRGNALQKLAYYEKAMADFDKAITLDPESPAHWNKGLLKLLSGDFDEGWKLYEWRHKVENRDAPVPTKPLWLGETPLSGKTILLSAEQGLGDVIQFCRYAAMVEALGAKVILPVPASLVTVIATLKGSFHITAEGTPLPEYDLHCPLLSLPLALKTRLNTIPANIPYLFADAHKQKEWRKRLGTKIKRRIGLVWAGGAMHNNDHNRSIAPSILQPLLTLDSEYHCLQKELRPGDGIIFEGKNPVISYTDDIQDFADTAALIAEMDIILSVDTSVAHLAGAMGKPVWMLLPFAPDWRWLLERSDSPWYPTARLFRQPRNGDWQSVIDKVRVGLA